MGTVIPLAQHHRYRFPTVELPQSFIDVQAVFGLRRIGKPYAFEFHRRKKGCEVWLRFHGGLHVNLSIEHGYFEHRAEGRAWACQFASRYGFEPMEYKR